MNRNTIKAAAHRAALGAIKKAVQDGLITMPSAQTMTEQECAQFNEALAVITSDLSHEASRLEALAARPRPKYKKGTRVVFDESGLVYIVQSSSWYGDSQGYYYILKLEAGPSLYSIRERFEVALAPAPKKTAQTGAEGK